MKFDIHVWAACMAAAALAGCGGGSGSGGGGGLAFAAKTEGVAASATEAQGEVAAATPAAAAALATAEGNASKLATKATSGSLRKDESWVKIADEGGRIDVPAGTTVAYGADPYWLIKSVGGQTSCDNALFGSDPYLYVGKACYTVPDGATATVSAPVTAPAAVAVAGATAAGGDVVDGAGNIDANAYRAMAAVMSKDAGIAYRYGPQASAYGVSDAGLPTHFQRQDNVVAVPPHKWQIGSYQGDPGPYSNNQANVIFAADNPSLHLGVSDIQVTTYDHNTFSQSPQLPWQIAMAPGGGLDSVIPMDLKSRGVVTGDPVAIARCGTTPGFCATSLVAYQNGVIATAGTNTATNRSFVKLPANKVPTGIAVTNNGEFALVTVWDTDAVKGQLAVVALAGLCDGCTPDNPGRWYDWWHEWMGVYPGLPNQGNFAFMKIMGYVDLPGITAPTEVSVTTGLHPWKTLHTNGEFIGYNTPLNSQSNRESFLDGGSNAGRYSRGGVAVVVSKSEKKAAFVDLRPLFGYVNSVYFQGSVDQFNATMATLGQGDDQWPHRFSYKPEATPTIIKTVSFDSPPTAVRNTNFASPARAFIATEDGNVHLWSLGGYATGATAAATDIDRKASVFAGRNPTSLAISKADPDPDGTSLQNSGQVIVASRGDRKLVWVRASPDGNSASVVRTVQDTRMIDPIAVEDADDFATVVNTVSVADYAGKKVSNYRFGPVVFAGGGSCPKPAGCAANGDVEFGGSMDFPGKPFGIKTANVP